MSREDDFWAVRAWWNGRIREGFQLSNTVGMSEGNEFWGPDEWKKFVLLEALKRDFEAYNGGPIVFFKASFMKATKNDDIVLKMLRVDVRSNLRLRLPKEYVRFGKRPLTPLPE